MSEHLTRTTSAPAENTSSPGRALIEANLPLIQRLRSGRKEGA